MTSPRHEKLLADLAELKLYRIAELYQEVLNEAARKQSSMLDVLTALIGEEIVVRRQRALERRLRRVACPAEDAPRVQVRLPQTRSETGHLAAVRLRLHCPTRVRGLIGPTGTGKSHLLNALGHTACEKGFSVQFTRVVDMINVLTTAKINGTLEKELRQFTTPHLLLLGAGLEMAVISGCWWAAVWGWGPAVAGRVRGAALLGTQ